MVERAREFARRAHEGQKRSGGDPFFTHPENVANLIEEYKPNSRNLDVLKAAAYLHDTLEDTKVTYYQLVDEFGHFVSSLVMELTTNEDMKKGIGAKKYFAYNLIHMTSYALDLKLCDRLSNIRDLKGFKPERKKRFIDETIFILDFLQVNRQLTKVQCRIIGDLWEAIHLQS